MTWLIWRQHRGEVLALGLLVLVVGVLLVVLGQPMHDLLPLGAGHCATPPVDAGCRSGITALQQEYGYATPMLILFNLVPFAIGAFLGAPLLARELETGTWQLAWTQGVPRMRWLLVKLAALGGVTVLLTAAFASATTWYREPLNLFGRFQIDGFDVSGVAPLGYALFAFAVATAAGVLLRRSLPAMGAALVIFVAVRASVAVWLRPHYRAPISVVEEVARGTAAGGSGDGGVGLDSVRDWTLGEGLSDAAGNHLSNAASFIVDHQAEVAGVDAGTYMHDQGIHRWAIYHPAERFWTFQLMEVGIFVGLAAVLLLVVVLRVKRRSF